RFLFFYSCPATPPLFPLSLHDALPILAAPPAWWVAVFYVAIGVAVAFPVFRPPRRWAIALAVMWCAVALLFSGQGIAAFQRPKTDRKSTRLNSSHRTISYAVFCLKKKK